MTFQEMIAQTPFEVAYREAWGGFTILAPEKVDFKPGDEAAPIGLMLRAKDGELREFWRPSFHDIYKATDWVVVR